MAEVIVLRLSHRIKRDARVTTHVFLVARAFNAKGCIYTGSEDKNIEKNISNVVKKWGGEFFVSYQKSWKEVVKDYKNKGFSIIHLTMYGIPIQNCIEEIRKNDKILVIVGSERVPGEIYHNSDFNIAITNQPHSEIAALSIFLHEYFKGKELEKGFENAKIKIIPMEKGKRVIKINEEKENQRN